MHNATVGDRSNSQAKEGENGEELRGWIAIILSIFLVFSTTTLFTAGHAYQLSYWYERGLDLAQLPVNFHETLFWGFAGGGPLLFAWLIGALIALLACGLGIWLTTALWKRAKRRWPRLRRTSPAPPRPGRKIETHVKLILASFLLLPTIYLLGMAYIGMAEFQRAGSKKGKELVEALRTDAAAASAKYGIQEIELRFGPPTNTVVRGYRLLCTESLCSIYDPDPNVRAIRLVSLENLLEIRVLEPGRNTDRAHADSNR